MRGAIFGAGWLSAGAWIGIALLFWPDNAIAWLLAGPVFVAGCGAMAIVLHWPAVQHERHVHIAAAERLKTEAWQSQQQRNPQPIIRAEAGYDAEAERQYRWNQFWRDCLLYAAERDGNFAYRGCFESILRWEEWHNSFALPLVKARWLQPIQASIRTRPLDGWTVVRMLGELAAGAPPPYPIGEPPQLRQTARENTLKHGENTTAVFAAEE